MTIGRAEIAALIPHSGRMCLLDAVEDWTPTTIRARSMTHHDTDNPLARGGILPILAGLEYGAQAAAVHDRLAVPYEGAARDGLIVAVRALAWTSERLDDIAGPLIAEAERLAGDGRSAVYEFRILGTDRPRLSGRITVLLKLEAA